MKTMENFSFNCTFCANVIAFNLFRTFVCFLVKQGKIITDVFAFQRGNPVVSLPVCLDKLPLSHPSPRGSLKYWILFRISQIYKSLPTYKLLVFALD